MKIIFGFMILLSFPGESYSAFEKHEQNHLNPCSLLYLNRDDLSRYSTIDFARAYSKARLFSPVADFSDGDHALANAFEKGDVADDEFIGIFSDQHPGICSSKIKLLSRSLSVAKRVSTKNHIVVFDLREFPMDDKAISEMIEILSCYITGQIYISGSSVRKFIGFPGQNMETHHTSLMETLKPQVLDSNIRSCRQVMKETKEENNGIVILSDSSLPPMLGRTTGSLRLQQLVWLAGTGIGAEKLESIFNMLNPWIMGYRAINLYFKNQRWPDFIPADISVDDFLKKENLEEFVHMPPILNLPNARRKIISRLKFDKINHLPFSTANFKASLFGIYSVLRLFYPYFDVVGDHLDERFQEIYSLIETSGSLSKRQAFILLKRFGEVLKDGHQFVFYDRGPTWKMLPIAMDNIENKVVVTKSNIETLPVGTIILKKDGLNVQKWFENAYNWTSAASPGYRFNLAAREFLWFNTSTTLLVSDGTAKKRITFDEDFQALPLVNHLTFNRENGFLTALGSKNVYYLNVDESELKSNADFHEAIFEIFDNSTEGVIIDMRGYPKLDTDIIVERFVCKNVIYSNQFIDPVWVGPFSFSRLTNQYKLNNEHRKFCGPRVLIVGPATISAAEHFAQELTQDQEILVVGRPSGATNGTLVDFGIPGGFYFSFTGLEMKNPDGSEFHGIGIQPDFPSNITLDGLRSNQDEVLHQALKVLNLIKGRKGIK